MQLQGSEWVIAILVYNTHRPRIMNSPHQVVHILHTCRPAKPMPYFLASSNSSRRIEAWYFNMLASSRFLYSYKTDWEHKLSTLPTCSSPASSFCCTDTWMCTQLYTHFPTPTIIFVVTKQMHRYSNGLNSSPLELHCSVTPYLMKQES